MPGGGYQGNEEGQHVLTGDAHSACPMLDLAVCPSLQNFVGQKLRSSESEYCELLPKPFLQQENSDLLPDTAF